MSGGVPKRISISRTQSNTPSKAGNVMAKKAIVLCNGRRARTAMCNYVMKRTRPKVVYPGPGAGWTLVKDANFRLAVQAIYPGVIARRFEIAFNTYEYYFENSTINTITDLGTPGFSLDSKNISDLTGISGFTALTNLNVSSNNLTALNVNSSTSLIELDCANNQISSLNVTNNPVLTNLNCANNQIPSLDVTTNSQLEILNISNDNAITTLNCAGLSLTQLLLVGCTALTILDCNNNSLASLDVTSCEALTILDCNNNSLASLDVTSCTLLTKLECYNNSLASLDVTSNPALTYLNCANNNISTTFNLNNNDQLSYLNCSNNSIPNFSGGASLPSTLTTIDCGSNPLNNSTPTAPAVNVSGINGLKTLKVNNSQISDLSCVNLDLNLLDVTDCSLLTSLDCGQNKLTSLDLSGCTGLTSLDCQGTQGLPGITSLDVSQQTLLTSLVCNFNSLTSLDVSSCTLLTKLECFENQIAGVFDVTNNTALQTLDIQSNQISGTLNITNNTNLEELYCNNNALTGLQIVPFDPPVATALKIVKCHNNQITTALDFTGGNFAFLEELDCTKNKIPSLDVVNRNLLKYLRCGDNELTSLNLIGCVGLGAPGVAGRDVYCNNNNIITNQSILTDFQDGDFDLSTFSAYPQNSLLPLPVDYCRVADAQAVTYFATNFPAGTNIPVGANYYF